MYYELMLKCAMTISTLNQESVRILFSSLTLFFSFQYIDWKNSVSPTLEGPLICVHMIVGAGTITLISNSDGRGPSIFSRKMKWTRGMREENDGRSIYFRSESAFSLSCSIMKVRLPICTLTRRVHSYVFCLK